MSSYRVSARPADDGTWAWTVYKLSPDDASGTGVKLVKGSSKSLGRVLDDARNMVYHLRAVPFEEVFVVDDNVAAS